MSIQADKRNWSTQLVVLLPYLWLAIFLLAPFVIVLKISLSQTALAQPPYLPLLDVAAGWAALIEFTRQLSVDSFRLLISDQIYLLSYLKSLQATPVFERGKFANYIAPPLRGVNQRPIDFEYVRTEA